MIKIKPISINDCFQGRRFKNNEFKKWQKAVIKEMWFGRQMGGWGKRLVEVAFRFYLKRPFNSDADNFLKPAQDCLVKAGILKYDRYVMKVSSEKIKSEEEGFDFIIKPYKNENQNNRN